MANTKEFLLAVENCLRFHKIIVDGDTVTDDNLKNLVADFQEKINILVDGVIGPETLWQMQYPYVTSQAKMHWIDCPADKIPGIEGASKFEFRDDTAVMYNNLRKEIVDLGGKVTSSGSKRELNAEVNTSRYSKSMHYTGLAFDLSINSGFFKPDTDPFIISKNKEGDKYWTVYCRATGGQEMEIEATFWDGWKSGVDKTKQIKGNFLNFTELAQKHGFYPINPRIGFTRPDRRDYLSSEWWHFQANSLLIKGFAQFGIELLKLNGYTPESIQAANSEIWSNRKSIYGQNWG